MSRLLTLILLCLLCNVLISQEKKSFLAHIAAIDMLKNDTNALKLLEGLKKEALTSQQRLQTDVRITMLASRLQQFQKSIALGTESITKIHNTGQDSLEAAFNLQVGAAYYYMDQRKKALGYFETAAQLSEKAGQWLLANKCYNNIGGVYTDLKKYEQAEAFLLKAIAIMNEHGMSEDRSNLLTLRVLGALYSDRQKISEAKRTYRQMLAKEGVKRDTGMLADVLIYYSHILLKEGRLDSADILSEKALNYSRGKKMFHELLPVLSYRAKVLSTAGRDKEALELIGEAFRIQKQSFSKDLDKQIGEMEVKYKTAQLKQEKDLAASEAKKRQQLYLLGFMALLACTFVSFYIFNLRKNNRQSLEAHQQRLKALVEGEEKERSRIAKDLHDGIVQDLTAIKLKVLYGNQGSNFTEEIGQAIDLAAKDVRNIAYRMMPVALREYGLIEAMDDLLQKTLAPLSIPYEFETVNIEGRLAENIEICIYRIAQELLHNVIKHSKASFVSVVISKRRDAVSFILEDNGEGFDETEIRKGIGMAGLSSRLEIVNGELKYESAKGAGTMAIIRIPL